MSRLPSTPEDWIKHQLVLLAGFKGPTNVADAYYNPDHYPTLQQDPDFMEIVGHITGWCKARGVTFEQLLAQTEHK